MGTRVLLVDDSPTRIERIRDSLSSMGCTVAACRGAQGALSLLSSCDYDVVFVNWFLEDMLLHDFAEAARRTRGEVAVIVTFDGGDRLRPRTLDYPGVDGWVPYLCDDRLLRDVVESVRPSRMARLV